jgi:hypothetical protein
MLVDRLLGGVEDLLLGSGMRRSVIPKDNPASVLRRKPISLMRSSRSIVAAAEN